MSERAPPKPSAGASAATVVDQDQNTEIDESIQGAHANVGGSLSQTRLEAVTAAQLNSNVQAQEEQIEQEQANTQIVAAIGLDANQAIIREMEDEYDEDREQIEANFDPGRLTMEYAGLSRLARIALILLILVLACVLGWMTWQFISFAWPHLMEFITRYGPDIAGAWNGFLEGWARHPIVLSFDKQVGTLSRSAVAEGLGTPEMTTRAVTTGGSMMMLELIQLMFNYLESRQRNTRKRD